MRYNIIRTEMSEKLIYYVKKFSIFLVMVALIVGMVGCWGASPPSETHTPIWDWNDLDAIRDNLGGSYILMTDLTKNKEDTPGYDELAGPTANGGKGWEPIGTEFSQFKGHFNGQGYEIRDLVINRPDQNHVGLFGYVGSGGSIANINMVNVAVSGKEFVGGLVGRNNGLVSNSHSSGTVAGERVVGGLVGWNAYGRVTSNSDSTCSVTGTDNIGGLVGWNEGWVYNSHSTTGSVTGTENVGGLTGCNHGAGGIVRESYSTGSVTGTENVGGLVGDNDGGKVSDSHSNGDVTGERVVGGLVGWNAPSSSLINSYSYGNVTGKEKVGSLVGWNNGDVTSSEGYGSVTVTGND
jgi:hypothetical protein